VQTRHVYGTGFEVLAEYESSDNWETEDLAREFLWGERFPEPLVLIDWTTGPEKAYHYLHDHLGSVIALVDAGDPEAKPEPIPPRVVERYTYDPYGTTYIETWKAELPAGCTTPSECGCESDGAGGYWCESDKSAYGNPFAWTAQRYDAGVGLYAFPFRGYSPSLGRFLQRDPLGYIDGPNLYEYARSMPTVLTDPLGLAVGLADVKGPAGGGNGAGGPDSGPGGTGGEEPKPGDGDNGDGKPDPCGSNGLDPDHAPQSPREAAERLIAAWKALIDELPDWLQEWLRDLVGLIETDFERFQSEFERWARSVQLYLQNLSDEEKLAELERRNQEARERIAELEAALEEMDPGWWNALKTGNTTVSALSLIISSFVGFAGGPPGVVTFFIRLGAVSGGTAAFAWYIDLVRASVPTPQPGEKLIWVTGPYGKPRPMLVPDTVDEDSWPWWLLR
jgi:RHS repeat-associated protein